MYNKWKWTSEGLKKNDSNTSSCAFFCSYEKKTLVRLTETHFILLMYSKISSLEMVLLHPLIGAKMRRILLTYCVSQVVWCGIVQSLFLLFSSHIRYFHCTGSPSFIILFTFLFSFSFYFTFPSLNWSKQRSHHLQTLMLPAVFMPL